jgi:hypothetical protein
MACIVDADDGGDDEEDADALDESVATVSPDDSVLGSTLLLLGSWRRMKRAR